MKKLLSIKALFLFAVFPFNLTCFSQLSIPFNCQNCSDESFYQVHSLANPSGSSISQIDVVNNAYSPLQNSPANIFINAIGMRPLDSLAYGIKWNTNELIKVDAQGIITNLGNTSNLPSNLYDAGDFGPNGLLHVRYNLGQTMYCINVGTNEVVKTYNFSTNIEPGDFTFNIIDSLFYSVNNNGELFTIDPNDGSIIIIGSSGLSGDFGAMFSDNTGRIWGLQNSTGNLYQFNIISGSANLATSIASSTLNDGFSCRNAVNTFEFNNVRLDSLSLQASAGDVEYQWVDCENNYEPILGATNQTFMPSYNSNFAVIIWQNGCIDTSSCVLVDFTGISEEINLLPIIYPNPSSTGLIQLNTSIANSDINVYSIEGKQINFTQSNDVIDISDNEKGVYLISIDGIVTRYVYQE
ncbi:MAG: T9SS type A sorting domain-containing protein [Flavobacteriales bacterium]|nr:T9SS type A sorting domain-containing protein [Flavobacteriales bacterium]